MIFECLDCGNEQSMAGACNKCVNSDVVPKYEVTYYEYDYISPSFKDRTEKIGVGGASRVPIKEEIDEEKKLLRMKKKL